MNKVKYSKKDLLAILKFTKGQSATGDLLHSDGSTLFRMNPSVQSLAIRESNQVVWLDVKDDIVQRKLKSLLPEGKLKVSKTFANSTLKENFDRLMRKSKLTD